MNKLAFLLESEYWRATLLLARIGLKSQYRNSFLGMGWALIQPAVYITVITFAFSIVLHVGKADFSMYLICGMSSWGLLTSALLGGSGTLIGRGGILKQVILPRSMFVVADTLTHIYIYFISFGAMYIVGALITGKISWMILLLPIVALPLFVTCFAGALIMAYVSVYLRDAVHLINVLLQALFWASPLVYTIESIPVQYRLYFYLNPFYALIRPIQQVAYYLELPHLLAYGYAWAVALLTLAISIAVYSRLRRNLVFYL